MNIKTIKETIENRMNELKLSKHQTNYHNGQLWARKDELSNLLAYIKKMEKSESQK